MTAISFPNPLPRSITKGKDAGSYAVLGPILEELETKEIDTADDLQAFLDACNEVYAWFSEHYGKTFLATSQDTKDSVEQNAWRTLNTETLPQAAPHFDRLNRKLLDSPSHKELEGTDYWHHVQQVQREVDLYREENVPLQAECSRLTSEYQQITSSWTVEFNGATHPLTEMGRFNEDPDRKVRKEAYLASANSRIRDAVRIDQIFAELLSLRQQISTNAGFENYRDYVFHERGRDYTPALCRDLAEHVRELVVPLRTLCIERKVRKLSLGAQRPWDLRADADGLPPLRPCVDSNTLVNLTSEVFRRISPDLAGVFDGLRDHMDLATRANKAPGGFMLQFDLERRPYIYANAAGLHEDAITLLHETGHAFHYLFGAERAPMAGMRPPIEFAEVASMTMELLPAPHFDVYYPDPAEAERARRASWSRALDVLTSAARGEEFQRRVYVDERGKSPSVIWREVCQEFDPDTDWSGHEETLEKGWHRVPHFFRVPFYFIEYGFAQLAALRFAKASESDPEATLQAYLSALKRGPCGTATSLYEAAGLPLLADADAISELMAWVSEMALPREE
jgi:oligoendopeptidase F